MRKTSGYTANYNSMQQIVCRHDTSFRYIYPVAETSPVHQRIKRRSDSRPARCRIDKIEIDPLSRGNLRNRWLVHDERPFLHIFFLFFFSLPVHSLPFAIWTGSCELLPLSWWTFRSHGDLMRISNYRVRRLFGTVREYRYSLSYFYTIKGSILYNRASWCILWKMEYRLLNDLFSLL